MTESIALFVQNYGPLGLMITLFLCSFGLPVAKSLVIVTGGILAGSDRGISWQLFLSCVIGLHLGDFAFFLVGRRWGEQALNHRWLIRIVPPSFMKRARDLIQKHGASSILLARVTPFVRSACYLSLGSLGMSAVLFTAVNLLAACAFTSVFFSIGFVVGDNPTRLEELAASGNLGFVIAALAMILILYMWRRHQVIQELPSQKE